MDLARITCRQHTRSALVLTVPYNPPSGPPRVLLRLPALQGLYILIVTQMFPQFVLIRACTEVSILTLLYCSKACAYPP